MNSIDSFLIRLHAKILKTPDGCWLWQGKNYVGGRGGHLKYGTISLAGKGWLVHRAAYSVLKGPIPEGLTLDHLCRVTLCVNPDHLEPVTLRENIQRSPILAARKAITHCPAGHPYAGHNLIHKQGASRQCRACTLAGQSREAKTPEGRAKQRARWHRNNETRLRRLAQQREYYRKNRVVLLAQQAASKKRKKALAACEAETPPTEGKEPPR